MKRLIRHGLLIGGAVIGVALCVYFWPAHFHYRSVCSVCGLEARTSEVHFGEFETGLAQSWGYETNAVAAILLMQPAVKGHEHAWVFAAGGGGRVKCAIGPGRHLWGALRSAEAAAFLEELTKAHDTNSLTNWRDRLLNSDLSRDATLAITVTKTDGYEGKAWLKTAEEEFQSLRPTGN